MRNSLTCLALLIAACNHAPGLPGPGGPNGDHCSGTSGSPFTLASSRDSPEGIAVDSTNVYWSESQSGGEHQILKVPVTGGTPVIVATDVRPTGSLAIHANALYWIDQGSCLEGCPIQYSVMKVALSGGKPTTLASGLKTPTSLAVDANNVYWADLGVSAGDGAIMKVGLDGGTPVPVVSAVNAASLAVDATSLYWTTVPTKAGNWADGAIMKMDLAGGAPKMLVSGQPGPNKLAVDGTSVYWIDFLWNNPVGGTVLKMALAGGNIQTLASGLNVPWDIAVDSSGVYWTTTGTGTTSGAEQGNEGSLMMLAAGETTPKVLAAGQNTGLLALAPASVVWTNGGTPANSVTDGAVLELCLATPIP